MLRATLTLNATLKGPRRALDRAQWRPTIFFPSRSEPLHYGITFLQAPEVLNPGESADVTFELLALPDPAVANVLAASAKPGDKFLITEGGAVIGSGVFHDG